MFQKHYVTAMAPTLGQFKQCIAYQYIQHTIDVPNWALATAHPMVTWKKHLSVYSGLPVPIPGHFHTEGGGGGEVVPTQPLSINNSLHHKFVNRSCYLTNHNFRFHSSFLLPSWFSFAFILYVCLCGVIFLKLDYLVVYYLVVYYLVVYYLVVYYLVVYYLVVCSVVWLVVARAACACPERTASHPSLVNTVCLHSSQRHRLREAHFPASGITPTRCATSVDRKDSLRDTCQCATTGPICDRQLSSFLKPKCTCSTAKCISEWVWPPPDERYTEECSTYRPRLWIESVYS